MYIDNYDVQYLNCLVFLNVSLKFHLTRVGLYIFCQSIVLFFYTKLGITTLKK